MTMYEVLEYESTLELKDRGGKRAAFKEPEKVRCLQGNIIAYQDQAWGDGGILVNYRCTPKAVLFARNLIILYTGAIIENLSIKVRDFLIR